MAERKDVDEAKATTETSPSEVVTAHCNRCLRDTNHDLIARDVETYNVNEMYGETEYEMMKCRGCNGVTFRRRSWFSDDTDEEGRPKIRENYYPPAISRQKPEWLKLWWYDHTHSEIGPLLNEIYAALHSDLRRLAGMGIRAVIDVVLVETVGDVGTFSEKLSAFMGKGYISEKQRKLIDSIIDAGSASAHRGYDPSAEDLNTLLDVTENLIETIYVHEGQVAAVTKKVPPRPKVGRSGRG
jgi:hypothetical protein